MKRIHFMGIGGSGMSAVAQIAQSHGFQVTGCDKETDTPYLQKVKQAGIPVFTGHDAKHVNNIDILAVSPAIFYQNDEHPETQTGRQQGILMKWQKFLGEYLHKDKQLICIAGTHGKSTTTAMAGLLLEAVGLDPTVEIGATVKQWHSNCRIGNGNWFISEADEYHDNFAHYHPNILILNNIEMDHPEYFQTQENLLAHYQRLVQRIRPDGHLIFNADSENIKLLLKKMNVFCHSDPAAAGEESRDPSIASQDDIDFSIHPYLYSEFPQNIHLQIPGIHNKANAMGIIKLAEILQIPSPLVTQSLSRFTGLSRRIEYLGTTSSGIKIYDDYANHPTAFAASIAGVKELEPNARIIAIIEPHTFSRLRAILSDLPDSVKQADEVIVTKIFASRETDLGDFTGTDIVGAMHHPHAQCILEFSDVNSYIKNHKSNFDVILVMGSGDSYKLSQQLLTDL